MTTNTRKIITLLTVLIVGAMMSGCIEFHEKASTAVYTESIYTIDQIPEYLTTHDLSAGMGELQITLHPDGTATVGDETGNWIVTGTGRGKWSCAITGVETVQYLDLHDGRIASAWINGVTVNGVWFR